eukprot:CAMPEP_0178403326 /NCGR_PEP_ID=MMETSP0689_2-20121128/17309_1 /TAXON_ID=160604 /ORGANISM="Amphidinium massartii, Strain CS-259" /LENGTH=415 /DNA_ID=CAMNT_0020024273 /DNA_START=173 /DNA_END=1420 /DNA_ORIENTATION=+
MMKMRRGIPMLRWSHVVLACLAATTGRGASATSSSSCPWAEGQNPYEKDPKVASKVWWPAMIATEARPTIASASRTEIGEETQEVSLLPETCNTAITTQGWQYSGEALGPSGDWTANYTGLEKFQITVGETTCAMSQIAFGAFSHESASLRMYFQECSPPVGIVVPLNASLNSTFNLASWMCGVEELTSPGADINRPCKNAVEALGSTLPNTTAAGLAVGDVLRAFEQVAFEQYQPAEDTPGCFDAFNWLVAMTPLAVSTETWDILTHIRTELQGDYLSTGVPMVRVAMTPVCVKGCDGTCPLTKAGYVGRAIPMACLGSSEVMLWPILVCLVLMVVVAIITYLCTNKDERRHVLGLKGKDGKIYREVEMDPKGTMTAPLKSRNNMDTQTIPISGDNMVTIGPVRDSGGDGCTLM